MSLQLIKINSGSSSDIKFSDTLIGVGGSNDGILDNTDPEYTPSPIGDGVVDVVSSFNWYTGPKAETNALNKVPRAFIVERRQVLSSLISGALYYLNTIAGTASNLATRSSGRARADGNAGNVSKLKCYLQKINATVSDGIKNGAQGLQNRVTGTDDKAILQVHNLMSLLGIYYTEKTGFKYVFPYYGKTPDISNSWGSGGEGAVAGLVNSGMEVIDEISKITNIAQPGVYIQKPKYFNFAEEGKSITVSFPLFNTIRRGTQRPYQRNYELLWLLAFQNRPYKTSFARTPPPKIYSVTVPGVYSTPYSYISSLSIDFKGTTRQLEVSTPTLNSSGNSAKLTTVGTLVPIPEAYVVNITFTSLLNDYANQMIGPSFTSKIEGDKVTYGADV